MKNGYRIRTVAGLSLLLLTGCETERSIGSTCVGASCAQVLADAGDQSVECVVSTVELEVAVDGDHLADGVCLPRAIPRQSDHTIPCSMYWDLSETSASCDDFDFAEQADDGRCVIAQSPVVPGEFSGVRGWFYDENPPVGTCGEDFHPEQRIALTSDVRLPEGTRVRMACAQAWADPNEAAPALGLGREPIAIDPEYCAAPQGEGAPSDLGEACIPALLEHGLYDDLQAYVNLGSSECESGACLAYHLDSRQLPEGGREYPSLAERALCTCRCDAPEGEPECDCSEGFTCVDVLSPNAPRELAGGYCVRNNLIGQ